ncbi:MAG: flagellar basal-body MS-ring/collar protein FliF [Gammaproteobacteria bacterium]|nr:flagellar basal-body MS-ring/collar protein FliF [Gammaproteobacteria bacterium]
MPALDQAVVLEGATALAGNHGSADKGFVATVERVSESVAIKKVGLLIALALAIAIGVVVALWTVEPRYQALFTQLADADTSAIMQSLQSSQIEYRVDPATGNLLVPTAKIREIKLNLATQGLPQGKANGLEMLQKDQSLSTSQFIESARYKHALEIELARSVSSLLGVESARVHLAINKQSVFVRKKIKPTASVLVKLYQGRSLESSQVSAIVHLVASSIAYLEPSQVTVIDQYGTLLTNNGGNSDLSLTGKQFDYSKKVEDSFAQRILGILEPMVGLGRVRAQVSVAVDFSSSESSKEQFDPKQRALRSEQVSDQRNGANQPMGIPGALSNQPPGEGSTDKKAFDEVQGEGTQTHSATRNFEVDKQISRTRHASGTLTRLTAAVIIDEPTLLDKEGNRQPSSYDQAQLDKFTALVKEAIGFSKERGDSVLVVSSAFHKEEIAVIPELPIWQEVWLQELIKQVLSGLFLLIVMLLIVRPLIKAVSHSQKLAELKQKQQLTAQKNQVEAREQAKSEGIEGELTEGEVILSGDEKLTALLTDKSQEGYEKKIEYARELVAEDPKKVANMVKGWLEVDES